MTTPLRVLLIEDSENDAELLLRELRRGGYAPEFERVETPEELDDALTRQSWDLIISDYGMLRFNGVQALQLTQEKGIDIPFILVSGSIGEDIAVAAMKAGAHDYLMKDNLARLLPAIARELRESKTRQQHRHLNAELRQFKNTLDQTLDCVFMFDPDTLRFIYVNEGAKRQVGYSEAELLKMTPADIQPELALERLQETLRPLVESVLPLIRLQTIHRHKDRHDIPVEISIQLVRPESEKPRFVAVVRDITERKKAEDALRESEQRLRIIIETEPECVKIVSPQGSLLEMNAAGLAMLEVESLAEAQHGLLTDFILPEYRDDFRALHSRVMHGKSGMLEFEVRGLRGTQRWLETHAAPLRNAANEVVSVLAVTRDITERKRAEEEIHRLAYIDTITGLPNRTRFHELVQEAVVAAQREQRPIALLLLNLDHFKDVNNTLGHDRGDSLLQQVGLRLRSALFERDVVARIGGDEFGILLPRLAASDDVQHVIKNLHACLEAPFMIDGIPIVVDTSIGVATMPEHADNTDTLLQRADIAMYHAKQMALDYTVYAPEFNPHSPERLRLMAELRDAIQQNQLVLHFQPKLALKTGRIVGTEALVRWQHPRLGMVPADQFIVAAEQTWLIDPLTRWVLIDALNHCQGARREGIPPRVSVNLSARSLHDPHLPKMIADALAATGTEPGQLMLEVTESALVLDPKRAEQTLVALSSMGIGLSIDDFGTGYTSLSSIKRLPINEIKIDKSFVTNMLTDKKDATIVRAVIELGHNFGLTVVAEGVETKEVLDALTALGCDEAQGYFISKPQTYEQLKSWFSTSAWKI